MNRFKKIKKNATPELSIEEVSSMAAQVEKQSLAHQNDDILPPSWEKRLHQSGRFYYINHESQNTQWEHPKVGHFDIENERCSDRSRPDSNKSGVAVLVEHALPLDAEFGSYESKSSEVEMAAELRSNDYLLQSKNPNIQMVKGPVIGDDSINNPTENSKSEISETGIEGTKHLSPEVELVGKVSANSDISETQMTEESSRNVDMSANAESEFANEVGKTSTKAFSTETCLYELTSVKVDTEGDVLENSGVEIISEHSINTDDESENCRAVVQTGLGTALIGEVAEL